MAEFNPKLTIITITYNAAATLERTILSVAAQQYQNIEHIIVDGASTDDTLEIVQRHSSSITRWVSEPDNGLYFAMNKGLQMATGDYIWYINAGDEITTPETVEQMFALSANADLYYGDTVMTDIDGNIIGERRLAPPPNLNWTSFKRGMLVSHQSFVPKRALCQPYDTRFRFSADFDWCIRIMKQSKNIVNTDLVLSRFLDGGITKQNILAGLKERFRIMTRHYGVLSTIFFHVPIAIKFFNYWLRKGRF